MAEIADVTFYMGQSPRLALFDSSAVTSVTMQDLVDTFRAYEANIGQTDDANLLAAYGKQELTDTASVAITVVCNDLVVAFSPNTTIASSGTITASDYVNGAWFLEDLSATFVSDGVERGAIIRNETDGSMASVLRVDSETELLTWPLEGGVDGLWEVGDSYNIWNVRACYLEQGNITAIDALGAKMKPVMSTFATQVNYAASSSAALIDEAVILSTVQSTDTTVQSIDSTVQSIESDISNEILPSLSRLLGLSHENSYLDNTVHDGDGQLLSARLRIFDSKTNVEAATDGGSETTGLIATYLISADYEAVGQLQYYRMLRSA